MWSAEVETSGSFCQQPSSILIERQARHMPRVGDFLQRAENIFSDQVADVNISRKDPDLHFSQGLSKHNHTLSLDV